MAEHRVGAVLIMTEDRLVGGIFTERDLLVRVVHAGLDPKTTPISLVMTRDVRFVTPGTTIEAALSLMHVNRHRHLLVIDGPTVYGLVSMRDLVRQMIRARRRPVRGGGARMRAQRARVTAQPIPSRTRMASTSAPGWS